VGSRFLVLDIDPYAMNAMAMVMEKKLSGHSHSGQIVVTRDELPDPLPENVSWYRAALDVVVQKADMIACREAVVLIPGRTVFFRNISLPFSSPGKIAQVLPLELPPYLPEENCVSDFIPLDIRFVKDQHLILTASASDEMVQEIVSSLKAYHLRPRIISPKETVLAAAGMHQSGTDSDRVIIHAGLSGITLILMVGARPVMVRSLASSDHSPDLIVHHMLRMVTGFRHRSGLDTRFHISLVTETDAMEPASLTKAIQQKDETAAFFFSDTVTMMAPDPILVSDLMFNKSHLLFNFVKQYPGFGNLFHKFRRELLVTGTVGVLVITLFFMGLYQDVRLLENQVAAARRAGIEMFRQTFPQEPVLSGHSPLLRMQAQVKQALSQNSGAQVRDMTGLPALPAIDVLYELSARVPDDMNLRLSRLLLNNNQVTISGTTDSFNTVDRLKNALEQSDIFKTVAIHTADAARVENQVIFQFRIEM
jgi:general secretion pathway protein L